MIQIENWTSDPLQQQGVTLSDGTVLTLLIYYRPNQLGWFIQSLTWQNFTVTGLRITNNINLLLQWKNLLNFGLACTTVDGREPALIQDFSSGASTLWILEAADVLSLDTILAGAL
jgi:hypothetical protein